MKFKKNTPFHFKIATRIICLGKKHIIPLLILISLTPPFLHAQPPTKITLKTQKSTLELTREGHLTIRSTNEALPFIQSDNSNWWTMKLWIPSENELVGEGADIQGDEQTAQITTSGNSGKISYEKLKFNDQELDISLSIEISVENEAYYFTATIDNAEAEWVVREFKMPDIDHLQSPEGPLTLYWPNGLGERFTDPVTFGRRGLTYPSGSATMEWFTVENEQGGMYIASHDPERFSKRIIVSAEDDDESYGATIIQFPFCKEKMVLPSIVIQPYEGDWHTAARIYRNWYDTQLTHYPTPEWVRRSSGWLLTILKQQNGDVMWSYDDMEKLCDVTDEWNLDVIGLFGWAHGGHDYLYPDYFPDPLMGGTDKLKAALKLARERGKRTILYTNGQLMDVSTDFYRYNGNDVMAIDERRRPYVGPIRKFNSTTPVVFAKGCMGAERWQQRMMELAEQAYALGADGILYDQVGVVGPALCFNEHHLHNSPSTAYTTYRYDMLKKIADHMRQKDPDFIVMSEGVIDAFRESVPFSHGWGEGFNFSNPFMLAGVEELRSQNDLVMNQSNAFPELFRYTFPEHVLTQRHATPMQDRQYANYACLYGLRHELESRYQADVRYLVDNEIPDDHAYDDPAYYTPDVPLMQSISPEEAKNYMHTLLGFERNFQHILWDGNFIDTDGIAVEGEGIKAKGYKNGDQIGVLVWNYTNEPQNAKVKVEGYSLKETHEPEAGKVKAGEPIPAQSVRLLVWEK